MPSVAKLKRSKTSGDANDVIFGKAGHIKGGGRFWRKADLQ
jgi:hypothetical protein